jgi:hypothetical protein
MKAVLSLLMAVCIASAADVANMTGSWKLNVKKSKFDRQKAAPTDVTLRIEHNEPALKYSGSVTGSQEGHPDTFEFDGAIDEKIYPVKESADTGRTIKFKRKSANTVESWSSDRDHVEEEYAVTTVSNDGKSLVRTIHVKHKDGTKRNWTEHYDKVS